MMVAQSYHTAPEQLNITKSRTSNLFRSHSLSPISPCRFSRSKNKEFRSLYNFPWQSVQQYSITAPPYKKHKYKNLPLIIFGICIGADLMISCALCRLLCCEWWKKNIKVQSRPYVKWEQKQWRLLQLNNYTNRKLNPLPYISRPVPYAFPRETTETKMLFLNSTKITF